jgi:hypothetical protein
MCDVLYMHVCTQNGLFSIVERVTSCSVKHCCR